MSVICVTAQTNRATYSKNQRWRGNDPSQLRRMNMNAQEIGLLSNEALDAVVGGMMNNGKANIYPRPRVTFLHLAKTALPATDPIGVR